MFVYVWIGLEGFDRFGIGLNRLDRFGYVGICFAFGKVWIRLDRIG